MINSNNYNCDIYLLRRVRVNIERVYIAGLRVVGRTTTRQYNAIYYTQ